MEMFVEFDKKEENSNLKTSQAFSKKLLKPKKKRKWKSLYIFEAETLRKPFQYTNNRIKWEGRLETGHPLVTSPWETADLAWPRIWQKVTPHQNDYLSQNSDPEKSDAADPDSIYSQMMKISDNSSQATALVDVVCNW